MITDPRTGKRSIRAARETFAAVALLSLTAGTVLRAVEGRPGGFAGALLTLMALAVVSRYRVSWDQDGISHQTPFGCRRRSWSEFSGYRVEPERQEGTARPASRPALAGRCRLRLYGRRSRLTIGLAPYCWQDIRHLTDRVSTELPERESRATS